MRKLFVLLMVVMVLALLASCNQVIPQPTEPEPEYVTFESLAAPYVITYGEPTYTFVDLVAGGSRITITWLWPDVARVTFGWDTAESWHEYWIVVSEMVAEGEVRDAK